MQKECALCAGQADAVADYTVGLLLALDRSIVERELIRNDGRWRRDVSVTPPYRALGLMKIGVLGFGIVAQAVIRRLLPFGCRILVYDPAADEAEICALGCEPAGLDRLLSICDAVTLHLPLPAGRKWLIGREELALFKSMAWLINVTEAALVEEKALIDAVVHGKIAGAALDVFYREPLPPDYPLIGLPNVILTPHIAAAAFPWE